MIFKGAPYPIRQDPMGYFRTQTSIDQIKSDLLILLLTTPGSRCMLPNFGTPLKQLIFEPNDAALANRARDMIIESIRKWEPRIVVEEIEVSSSIDVDSLSNDDPRENIDNILSIRILFYDPENIKMVQELKLDIPLSGVG